MALGSGNLKIVFALLTEVITLNIQIIIVKIEVPGFEKPVEFVFSFANWSLVSDTLNKSPHKFLKGAII